jgi:hypothetical protein
VMHCERLVGQGYEKCELYIWKIVHDSMLAEWPDAGGVECRS